MLRVRWQGAYVGITTGLILTLWVGIGAQIYRPPILGHIPPPMNTTGCPYKNVSLNNTDWFTSTSQLPELSSTDNFASSTVSVEHRYEYEYEYSVEDE